MLDGPTKAACPDRIHPPGSDEDGCVFRLSVSNGLPASREEDANRLPAVLLMNTLDELRGRSPAASLWPLAASLEPSHSRRFD
ncbi:MAG: hypothetical protein CMJ84_15595 [Planctomycetes bacterium]|nr:hypothetical protein [Planctomycetota bacterium]